MLHHGLRVAPMLLDGDDALRCQRWCGCDQSLGVRMLWMLEHLERRAGFDDLSLIHHHDVLGSFRGQTQIMGDEQHCGAQ